LQRISILREKGNYEGGYFFPSKMSSKNCRKKSVSIEQRFWGFSGESMKNSNISLRKCWILQFFWTKNEYFLERENEILYNFKQLTLLFGSILWVQSRMWIQNFLKNDRKSHLNSEKFHLPILLQILNDGVVIQLMCLFIEGEHEKKLERIKQKKRKLKWHIFLFNHLFWL